MRMKLAALLVCLCIPAGAALGDDTLTGFYVGGDVGQSKERFNDTIFDVTASDTGYKVTAGFRPLDIVAGEVNYVSFGRANGGVNYADTDGIGVSGLLFLPIPLIDVYGRVGLFNWRVDANSPGDSFHRTGSDLAYGAGAGAHWGNLGARLEFEKFQVAGAKTLQLDTAGVTWTFGWPF